MSTDSVFKRIGSVIATTIDTVRTDLQEQIDNIPLPTTTTLGLDKVDNTSDLNKPISIATQNALNNKANVDHNHDTVYEPADATILKSAKIGVTVQPYNANTVVDSSYVHTDNNYTSAEKTKLLGIETGATADQTAPEILTLLKTVDGVGSGLDADLLDGQPGSYYTNYVDSKVAALVASSPATLDTLNELATALGNDPNFATTVTTQIGTKLDSSAYTASDVLTKIKTVDGSGSGLDADLLDGYDSAYFQAAATSLTTTTSFGGDVSGTYNSLVVANDSHNHTISTITGLQTALDSKLASTNYNASDVLTKVKTVDGANSGLDADLLDGVDGSGYIRFYQQAAAPTVANDGSIWKDTDTGMLFMAANDSGVLTWIGM